jgi:ATP-dependent DNA helicase RecG
MEVWQDLAELEWIPQPRRTALRRLGITKVEHLLNHFPRRYEDRHEFPEFPREESDTPICLCGEVIKTQLRRFGGWKKIFEATLEERNANALSQPLVCRWFNLHYVQKMIATGQQLVVFGKPRLRGKRICIDHPEFEVIENDEEISIHFRRITPIYPATEGVTQRVLRSIIYRILQQLSDEPLETLAPPTLVAGDRREAIQQIHFPRTWEALKDAREHLVLSEFFALQLMIATRRGERRLRTGQPHCGTGKLLEAFVQKLPFELTSAQQKVITEIRNDLAGTQPMNRLLQGDVGSGKTVVAISAILLAIEAGYQAALMAPTQILAEQHYAVLRQYLDRLGICIALRTAARREDNAPLPLFAERGNVPVSAGVSPAVFGNLPDLSSGARERGAKSVSVKGFTADGREEQVGSLCSPETCEPGEKSRVSATHVPQIIIGTHALLYEKVSFSNLGLVVIDEQHKFGVAQRARLTARDPAPDVLVMTATPIPRTLTMTVYGDLDVSVIDEMPRQRGKIITAVRDETKVGEVLNFLRGQLEAGRQAYVIYPLIEESEKLDVKAAATEFEKWRDRLHPFHCELLHGRIPAVEKQPTMDRFRRGQTQVLISTTVIEVGVDVPNATVMVVENAERFGLAQLHQLRGRIGRGEHKSYCILLTSDPAGETTAKLSVLEQTNNGFEIAEVDWDLRGPGDLLGTAQSGLPALKLGNLKADAPLMRRARGAATSVYHQDPRLEMAQNQHFRQLIVEEQGRTFSDVS